MLEEIIAHQFLFAHNQKDFHINLMFANMCLKRVFVLNFKSLMSLKVIYKWGRGPGVHRMTSLHLWSACGHQRKETSILLAPLVSSPLYSSFPFPSPSSSPTQLALLNLLPLFIPSLVTRLPFLGKPMFPHVSCFSSLTTPSLVPMCPPCASVSFLSSFLLPPPTFFP